MMGNPMNMMGNPMNMMGYNKKPYSVGSAEVITGFASDNANPIPVSAELLHAVHTSMRHELEVRLSILEREG